MDPESRTEATELAARIGAEIFGRRPSIPATCTGEQFAREAAGILFDARTILPHDA